MAQARLLFTGAGAFHGEPAPWADPLDRREWLVRAVPHRVALDFIAEHHYARGGPKTGVAGFALFHRGDAVPYGAALWVPPIIGAAKHIQPDDPHAVLGLPRLAVAPGCPKNAASFLIGGCVPELPDRYGTLLTYADEAQGHVGGIYQATNWDYAGVTASMPLWRRDGRQVSNKRGPKTLTHEQLRAEGAELVQRSRKHRYVLRLGQRMRAHPVYPKREAA